MFERREINFIKNAVIGVRNYTLRKALFDLVKKNIYIYFIFNFFLYFVFWKVLFTRTRYLLSCAELYDAVWPI